MENPERRLVIETSITISAFFEGHQSRVRDIIEMSENGWAEFYKDVIEAFIEVENEQDGKWDGGFDDACEDYVKRVLNKAESVGRWPYDEELQTLARETMSLMFPYGNDPG